LKEHGNLETDKLGIFSTLINDEEDLELIKPETKEFTKHFVESKVVFIFFYFFLDQSKHF